MPPRVSFICLYREAIHLQCFMPMRYVVVTRTYECDTFTQFAQNCNVGSLLALYGSPSLPSFPQNLMNALLSERKAIVKALVYQAIGIDVACPLSCIKSICAQANVTGYEKRDHLGFFIKIEYLACLDSSV